jgi:valyl-tRNA synthetase
VNRLFESYQFGEAGRQIYEFFWSEFADKYIEAAKPQLKEGGDRAFYTAWTLVRVLDKCLRMLHPFTPFVTEELWGLLKEACQSKSESFTPEDGWSEALIIANWPNSKGVESWESLAIDNFNKGDDHLRAIRLLKTELNIPVKQPTLGTIVPQKNFKDLINSQKEYISSGSATVFDIVDDVSDLVEYQNYPSTTVPSSGSIIYLKVDKGNSEQLQREKFQNQLEETNNLIKRLEKLLASDFAAKAPVQVVQKEREKLETYRQTAQRIQDQLK